MYEIFELFAEDSLLCKTPCKNKHKRTENLRWNGLVAEMERLVAELEPWCSGHGGEHLL